MKVQDLMGRECDHSYFKEKLQAELLLGYAKLFFFFVNQEIVLLKSGA